MDFLISMFPTLDKNIIQDVFNSQNNDIDKSVDELLTLAVGDDIFARSQFIEEKLSVSKNLGNNQQDNKRKQEEENLKKQQLAIEQKRKQEEENKRKLEELKARYKKLEELRKKEEKELEDKKKALEEKEAREKELERIKQEEANRKEPKVTIYTRKQQIIEGIDQDKIVKEIKELFTNNGINEDEILINDVSSDMELASYLKEICKQDEIQYPLVCAGNLPIGGVKRVQALVDNKDKLQQLIDGNYEPEFLTEEQTNSLKDGTGVFVGQGVFDHCLDAAEYVLSGVSTILWSPVTILTYPFRSAKEELKKGDEDLDFDIVHTNWYWRNLKRRFRFTKDSILRIHPTLNDVRASHPYTTIEIVRIMDDKSIIINYKDKSAPDHVTGTSEVISSMIELIKIRSASHNCKPIFINQAEL